MNREQAGNILDAYALLVTSKAKAASDALREVILDAMTEVRYYPINLTPMEPRINKPYISWTCDTNSNGSVMTVPYQDKSGITYSAECINGQEAVE